MHIIYLCFNICYVVVITIKINNHTMKHIFIGHDPRESLASIVCKYSIISNLSVNEEDISIQFINKKELQHQNVYYRKSIYILKRDSTLIP